MWTESLLFHTLPRPIGQFLENHWLPLMGECAMHARACTRTCWRRHIP